jgi:hypothetical protein
MKLKYAVIKQMLAEAPQMDMEETDVYLRSEFQSMPTIELLDRISHAIDEVLKNEHQS